MLLGVKLLTKWFPQIRNNFLETNPQMIGEQATVIGMQSIPWYSCVDICILEHPKNILQ